MRNLSPMCINRAIAITLLASCAASAALQRPQKGHAAAAAEAQPNDVLKDAESLLQQRQYAQAEEKLQALAGKQEKNPQFWFDLGFAQSHQDKMTEAAAAYKKAVALYPKWFEAQKNLGLALAKSGD